MHSITRRRFLHLTGTALVSSATIGFPSLVLGAGPRVVVVGGGVGGCTAAKYLRLFDPKIEVVLIEAEPQYHSCFLSNEYISGERSMESLTFSYDSLHDRGVRIVQGRATAIDPDKREVVTAAGEHFPYDYCIVSPGVDFKWDAIDGYSEELAETFPHAWNGGPQTEILRRQVQAMPENGVVAIVAPPNPFKCPPGPYERASQIAMYCKQHKPKAKILILDHKDAFTKQDLFTQGWTRLYGYGTGYSMIEWVSAAAGGAIEAIDPSENSLIGFVEDFQADVINIIPAQKANQIAFAADLVENDWCPVNKLTFESSRHPGIYVLGDASNASQMPKSAYAANSQAKICAAAIVSDVNGLPVPDEPSYVNTCYSILGPDYGISVAGVYRYDANNNMIVGIEGAGGVTPMDAAPRSLSREVTYAYSWFDNLIADMMG